MPLEKLFRTLSPSSLLKRRASTSSVYSSGNNSEVLDQSQLNEIYHRIINTSSVVIPETGETAHGHVINLVGDSGEITMGTLEENVPYGISGRVGWRGRLWGRFYLVWSYMYSMIAGYLSRDVLKCSIAYFIASLAVYNQSIGRMLGTSDNKHLVATVAVYFHPSRSIGSMHQSVLFIAISLLYSVGVSFLCAAILSYMYNIGEDEISYLINVTVISLAQGIVSVFKQKVGRQTFNVACSLASTSMISSIVKEGSRKAGSIPIDRLDSVFRIVVFGAVISIVLCYVLWPQSSQDKIKQQLNESYYLMSDLLSLLSDKFLTGSDTHELAVVKTQEQLRKNVISLKTALEETKYELLVSGKEKEYSILEKLVSSTVLLTRYLAGLKNSSDLQWKLLHELFSADIMETSHESSSDPASIYGSRNSRSRKSFRINEDEMLVHASSVLPHQTSDEDIGVSTRPINASQLFNMFIYYLGPPLKSFSFTIREILDNVPFEDEAPFDVIRTSRYATSLERAQSLFSDKQAKAMEKVYSDDLFRLIKGNELKADEEEVAASCFNFAYSLNEYSTELAKILTLLEDYAIIKENQPRSYKWIVGKHRQTLETPDIQNTYPAHNDRPHLNIFTQNPASNNFRYRIWRFFSYFRRSDVQFGVRVGIGAFFLSGVAFFPRTKEFFADWRLEWALVIYSIMINKSVGGTQMTVKWRIVGTFLGATVAVLTWKLFSGEPWALAIVGFLISIPSFNIILNWTSFNAYGRFILLTYNLTALYSYSMTLDEEEDDREGGNSPIIQEIGFHRFVSVSIGVMWAIFITTFVLPQSARSRLKKGLPVLWLQLGILWNGDPLGYKPCENSPDQYELTGIPEKFKIHELFSELETLCSQAPMELRLKGPFNATAYKALLRSTQTIINSIENAHMIIMKNAILTEGKAYVLDRIRAEREELEGRVLLNFYMIASAMKLGLPLPTKGVSTVHSKDRMLAKLAEVRHDQKNGQNVIVKDDDFTLVYSYILVSSQITDEIDKIIALVQELFDKVSPEELRL